MEAKDLVSRYCTLQKEHSKWLGVWGDCARYCMPNAAPINVLGRNRGGRKAQPVDVTGIECATRLSSWLYSSTVFQGEEWFSLKARNNKHMGAQSSMLENFLQSAARTALECINTSNFIQCYQQFLNSYSVFGTGVFYSEFTESGELICRQWPITQGVCIAENSKGIVDTVFRLFEFTARQAVQEFGEENVSDEIKKAANDTKDFDKPFKFLHAVMPRQKRDKKKKTPDNKPWAAYYVEYDKQKLVSEGGHDTFPYCIPRFFKTGEIYGRSPAMNALPALLSINIATRSYVKNVEYNSNPIVFAHPETFDKIDMVAGSFNPWDSQQGDLKIWSPAGGINEPLLFIQHQKEAVNSLFFCDVFQYLEDRKNMSATEAQLRHDEMIQGVAPVLANLHSEFFSVFITRVVTGLILSGQIQVPELYQGKGKGAMGGVPDFEVIYNTRLDTKLKGVLNANVINFVRMTGELFVALAQAPQATAYLDVDKIIRLYAANNNVSNDALKSDEDIQKALDDIQQQQAQQALMGKIKNLDLQKTPEEGSAMAAMEMM